MEKQQVESRIKGVKFLLFLAVVLSAFFSYEVGNRYFADPDEGRYVEIPREMVVTGDYITPKLDGLKYFEKPAMFYWMQAAVIKTIGINETSMRLWPVIFAVIGCLAVFLVGSQYYSGAVGLFSAGILATNILYYAHSRLIILDLVSSVLISCVLWCFFISFIKKSKHSNLWIILMYAFSALACLTKGLIGVILPGLVVFLWITFTGSWKRIKEMLNPWGIAVFFAIFLPWHIAVSIKNPDFPYFYFVGEHLLRYTTKMHDRYQPAWFFIPILVAGILPWTGFAIVAMKNMFKKFAKFESENVFLTCWIFGILAFFSFSNSKLIPYILPIVPPIAFITGKNIVDSIEQKTPDFKIGAIINIVLLAGACGAYFASKSQILDVLQNVDVALLVNAFLILLAILCVLLILAVYRKNDRFIFMFWVLFAAVNLMWIINKAAPYYQNEKKPTTKRLAKAIQINRSKNDLVYCYRRYYQDFPVYLNGTVGIVDFVGELEFGAKADKNNDKIISEKDFWQLWTGTNKRIFLLLSRQHYREVFTEKRISHKILDFDKHFIVIINK